MKLTKKHIGKLFDVRGGDGSWAYLLVDKKGCDLLFYTIGDNKYEIDTNCHADWRLFVPHFTPNKSDIANAWKTARRSK